MNLLFFFLSFGLLGVFAVYGLVVFFLACLISGCSAQEVQSFENFLNQPFSETTDIQPEAQKNSLRHEKLYNEALKNQEGIQSPLLKPKNSDEAEMLENLLMNPGDYKFVNALHKVLLVRKKQQLDAYWQDIFLSLKSLSPEKQKSLSTFYESHNYQAVWYDKNGTLSEQANLVQAVINREIHLTTPFSDPYLQLGDLKNSLQFDNDILKQDLTFTLRLISALEVIRNGLISVKGYGISESQGYKSFNLLEALTQIQQGNCEQQLFQLTDYHPQYALLKQQIENLAQIQKNGGYIPVPFGKNFTVGSSSPIIAQIRKRLFQMGFATRNLESNLFDQDLKEIIKRFQNSRGLAEDGAISSSVYRALSRAVSDDIKAVLVNIERVRHSPILPKHAKFVAVNVPHMELRVIENNQIVLLMKTIVGRKDRKTPIFNDKIEYVDFNPYWYVPYSLATKDILPKLKVNPNYLAQNNLKLFRGNQLVSAAGIKWKNYNEANFPFQLRQEPGHKNALGTVKFIFPNQYAVYLHDTPGKNVFYQSTRSESSGCIRIAKPKELSYQLLAGRKSLSEITGIFSSQKNRSVYLPTPMPIAIEYLTAFVQNGVLYTVADIYGYDEGLISQLSQKSR